MVKPFMLGIFGGALGIVLGLWFSQAPFGVAFCVGMLFFSCIGVAGALVGRMIGGILMIIGAIGALISGGFTLGVPILGVSIFIVFIVSGVTLLRRRGKPEAGQNITRSTCPTETQSQTMSVQPDVAPVSVPSFPIELTSQFSQARYLAEGGFTRVFSAVNRKGAPVAVKICKSYNPHVGKLFLTEAENWSILQQDNIVRLFNYNIFPIPYLESELCEGSLELEMNHSNISVERAVDIMRQVVRGIAYAHQQRILHRDIKPSNILLKGNVVKIGDWGLSKLKTEHSQPIAGITLQYAAPEELSRRFGSADERTDIYQLGVLFYQLMTGMLPFTGEESQIIHEILADAPTPPSKLCPISKELDNIILTCLKKCKEERYQNAEELLRDLDRVGN